jgi:RNA polymerase sigma factor (sigma-70 family)
MKATVVDDLDGLAQISLPEPGIFSLDPQQREDEKTPVLTREQEVAAFSLYNTARQRMCAFLHKYIDRKHEQQEVIAAQQHVKTIHRWRDYLVKMNMPLTIYAAKKYKGTLDWDQRLSTASMVLLKTVDGFDVSRGVKFSTYAMGSMLRMMTTEALKQKQDASTYSYEEGWSVLPRVENKRDYIDQQLQYDELADAIRHDPCLRARERFVLTARFLGKEQPTQEVIGNGLGVTRERIRQIEEAALAKIRKKLNVSLQQSSM